MRKLLLLMSILLVTACSKEALLEDNTQGQAVRMAVQAEQTRAQLDGVKVKWQANDPVWVNSKTYNLLGDQTNGWYLEIDNAANYTAIYPAPTANADGTIVTLPAIQSYVKDTFDPSAMIMVAEAAAGGNLAFKNSCGMVRLALTGNGETVTSITLTGNSSEVIAGAGSIGSAASSYLFTPSGAGKTITLNCDPSAVLSATATAFYIVVPKTTFATGFTCTVATDGFGVMTKRTTKAQSVDRSSILDMEPFAYVADPDGSIDLSAPVPSSVRATANCYVANLAGQTYRFPATVMGNGYKTPATSGYSGGGSAEGITPTVLNPKSAKLLWQTDAQLVSDIKLLNKQVYFTLNGTSGGTLTEGNAVIAVYSGENATGDILWSWHIWITAEDLNAKVQTYTLPGKYAAAGNTVVMDRNLGALKSGMWGANKDNLALGLMYQWGRKDPFLNIDDATITVSVISSLRKTYDASGTVLTYDNSAIATTDFAPEKWLYFVGKVIPKNEIARYPMNFGYDTSTTNWIDVACDDLWGNPYSEEIGETGHKSLYDPCPPGYRVPHRYFGTMATTDGENATIADVRSNGLYKDKTGYQTAGGNSFNGAEFAAGGMMFLFNGKIIPFRVGNYVAHYQVSMPTNSAKLAYRFYLDYGNVMPIRVDSNSRGIAGSVRCMKE